LDVPPEAESFMTLFRNLFASGVGLSPLAFYVCPAFPVKLPAKATIKELKPRRGVAQSLTQIMDAKGMSILSRSKKTEIL
jgi:hypothetical protein